MIACVRLPDFAASVELQHAGLPAATPLVVTHGPVVASVSHTARQAGVRIGMTARHARLCCPDARIVAATPLRYRVAADDLTALLTLCSERVCAGESAYPTADGDARWFIDLGARDLAASIDLTRAIRRLLRERGWEQAAIGVAATRFTAQCRAATLAPGESGCVPPGRERQFLAPLPIALLPLPTDLRERFDDLGLRTMGQIAMLTPAAVTAQCGDGGRFVHLLCRGQDQQPIPRYVHPPLLAMRRRFDGPVLDRRALELTLADLAPRLARRLDRRGTSTRSIGLALTFESILPYAERLALDAPTAQSDTIALASRRLLGRMSIRDGVESITVQCADLTPLATGQLSLFADASPVPDLRPATRESLLARFGPRRLFRPRADERDARLPERRYRLDELVAE